MALPQRRLRSGKIKMEKGKLVADAKNVLPLIREHLYSEREVFLRELISNAVDALDKMKIITRTNASQESDYEELRIDVHLDSRSDISTILVADNGIGMTYDDVKKFITQIAVSGASDFLKECDHSKGLIGSFGVGFYSVFLVASEARIETRSYIQGEKGCWWCSQGDVHFQMDYSERKERGTTVILKIPPEHTEFLNPERIKEIIKRYCDFVPYPIYLDSQLVNTIDAPWHKPKGTLPSRTYTDFYARMFPSANSSRFWIHLELDYPVVLRGIIYVPYAPTQKGEVRLFCNRVFVDDCFIEFVPQYIQFIRGVIDVEGIPLNLAREKIRQNRKIRTICFFIQDKLAKQFASIAKSQREDYTALWTSYERPLKIGAWQDDSWFNAIYQYLLFQSSRGMYTTLPEYLDRGHKAYPGVIYYLTDEHMQQPYLDTYRRKNIEVIYFTDEVDLLLLERIRDLAPEFAEFRRIDMDTGIVEPLSESGEKDEATELGFAHLVSSLWNNAQVEVASIKNSDLPVLLKRRCHDGRMADIEDLRRRFNENVEKKTLEDQAIILNRENPLITALHNIYQNNQQDPFLSEACRLLRSQTLAKFGLSDMEQKTSFFKDVETFLSWICREHQNS